MNSTDKNEEKLRWLWKLQNFNMKHELRVATTLKGTRIGSWIPLRDWLNISYIDHQTVLPNEVMWEIDHDDWKFVKKHGDNILEALDKFEVPHVQGPTSGKGFHIHAYFTGPDSCIRKELDGYGVLPRELRLALFGKICLEAGIPNNLIGKGLPIDTGCVDFSDLSMGHMVRSFGGRKFVGGYLAGYKTFTDGVPDERIRTKYFTDVRLPERIVPYYFPRTLTDELLRAMEKKRQDALKYSMTVQDGLYLNAPCVKALLEAGRNRGDRNRGAQIVAIACRLSGLSYEAAEEVMFHYHGNCERNDFQVSEVQGWLRWAYSREVDWRCSQAIPFGRCQPHKCSVMGMRLPRLKMPGGNPIWLRKWQRAPTVGWVQKRARRAVC